MMPEQEKIAATIEEARRVWESLKEPTHIAVATILTRAGKPVTRETVRKWKKSGWQLPTRVLSPAQISLNKIDAMVPILTGDRNTKLSDFVPGEALKSVRDDATRANLDMATDDTLITLTARTLHITNVVLMEEIAKHREYLVTKNPEGLAELVKAMMASLKNGSEAYTHVFMARERAMKLRQDQPPPDPQAPQIIPPGAVADPLSDEIGAYGRALTKVNGKA